MNQNLIVEKTIMINRPRDDVWRVLTEPYYLKQYLYGADLVTDWVVGRSVRFRGQFQGHMWEDKGVVLACEPPRRLQYSYYSGSCGLDDRPEHYATVTYQLDEAGGGTKLTVRQQGYASEESRNNSERGWEDILAKIKPLAETS